MGGAGVDFDLGTEQTRIVDLYWGGLEILNPFAAGNETLIWEIEHLSKPLWGGIARLLC